MLLRKISTTGGNVVMVSLDGENWGTLVRGATDLRFTENNTKVNIYKPLESRSVLQDPIPVSDIKDFDNAEAPFDFDSLMDYFGEESFF